MASSEHITSHPVGNGDLVASFGTLRHASFPDRVAAAAAAGFAGIGMSIAEYTRIRSHGWSDASMRRILNDFGVRLAEIEALVGFAAEPGPANLASRPGLIYADPEAERVAFHIADEFGSRSVQAVGVYCTDSLEAGVVGEFAALCDRAAEHGLLVALEFVHYSNIADLSTARAIVDAADRPNGGVCVDSWQFFRGGGHPEDMRDLGSTHIVKIELNDGPVPPADADPMVDAVSNRRCPGEGRFDLVGFVDHLVEAGVRAPVAVEVYSTELWSVPTAQAAQRAATGARSVLRDYASPTASPSRP